MPSKIIKIEDIANREEIEKAIRSRQIEGKHVIPVPAIEVKKSYSQIFHDSLRDIANKSKLKFLKKETSVMEKSIVTPEFSKKGRIEISEAALSQMAMHCINEFSQEINKNRQPRIQANNHNRRSVRPPAHRRDSQPTAVHNRKYRKIHRNFN